jgi:alpha-D-xyloside xylohydrolase
VPLGAAIQNTSAKQALTEVRVFPGRNASFTLYDDDGVSNSYKKDGGKSATLRWDEASRKLVASGALPTGQAPAPLVKVIGTQ